jgi:dynein regulatry complex protein 1
MQRDRAKKIQNEVITSHKKNVEIDWTWQELEEKEDCEELDKDIQVQKEACKAIINQKEDLIKAFMKQLQEKDDEYVKACRK